MKQLLLPNVVNPFSDKFLETWKLWQDFRQKFDAFWYKTDISQQMALKKLVEYSGGDEEKAILIVEQSISSEWTGFYNLRNSRSPNGKTGTTKPGETSLRDQSAAELVRRNASREQPPDSGNLKAV